MLRMPSTWRGSAVNQVAVYRPLDRLIDLAVAVFGLDLPERAFYPGADSFSIAY